MTEPGISIDLRELGPEGWGDRLRRARSSVTLAAATAYASQYVPCDASNLSRMESLPVRPDGGMGRRRRAIAYILCVGLYKVRPSELGLVDDDLPPNITITPAEVPEPASTWIAPVHQIAAAA